MKEFEKESITGKVFIGGYFFIFAWLTVHSFLAYWDLLVPWNITLWQHIRFHGAFILYLLLIAFSTWYLWCIWTKMDWSSSGATRWPLNTAINLAVQLLQFSNMSNEPFPAIGSGWFVDDLRYPAFMSQPYSFPLQIWFVNDMAYVLGCTDEPGKPSSYLFRLKRDLTVAENWAGWKENLNGILCMAYIYFGYFFIFMVVTRSWIERIILYIAILMARGYFASPKDFFKGRQYYLLSFVPVYALVRAYYSYTEWMSYGSRLVFVAKLAYCLSQLVIFAGWYSTESSKLGGFTWPYLKADISEEEVDEKETVETVDTVNAESDDVNVAKED